MLPRFYGCIRFFYQTRCTPAVLFSLCLLSFRQLPLCFLVASQLCTGFLCSTASLFLYALPLSLRCPAASLIKYCFAYVAGTPATRAIATSSIAVAADTAVHEADVVPLSAVLHDVDAAERA